MTHRKGCSCGPFEEECRYEFAKAAEGISKALAEWAEKSVALIVDVTRKHADRQNDQALAKRDEIIQSLTDTIMAIFEERPMPDSGEYPHHVVCSGSRRSRAGSPGCSCFPKMKKERSDLGSENKALRAEVDRLKKILETRLTDPLAGE